MCFRPASSSATKICPQCSAEVEADDRVCPMCGASIPDIASGLQVPGAPAGVSKRAGSPRAPIAPGAPIAPSAPTAPNPPEVPLSDEPR